MADASHAAVFVARRDSFGSLRDFVETACAREGVPHGERLRLMLLIEELFVNTIEHGHGGDCDAPIRLALTMTPVLVAVEYEDTAAPFDPFASVPAPTAAAGVEDRSVGGLGIFLITTMAEEVGYARRDDRNCITFRVARGR